MNMRLQNGVNLVSYTIILFILSCIMMSRVSYGKTRWIALYDVNSHMLKYKNTREYKESGNSYPVGKIKYVKLDRQAKFYWFKLSDIGIKYKKLKKKEFKKKIGKAKSGFLNYQICKVVLKKGKVVKIYGEYQA